MRSAGRSNFKDPHISAEKGIDLLILTRRIGEVIAIGDDIKVTLLTINGNQVRIGIQAPRSVPVHREEVYDRISAERDGGADDHADS